MPEGRVVEDEAGIAAIVRSMRTVAVIGMRGEEAADTPAHRIPKALQGRGIRIIPVNPKLREALGERAYGGIGEVPVPVDVVDVFRRPEAIGEVADAILALPPGRRPGVVWLQSGIRNDAAAARLAAAGLRVVQDRCLMVEAARHRPGGGSGNA
jgi:hypothetical protein